MYPRGCTSVCFSVVYPSCEEAAEYPTAQRHRACSVGIALQVRWASSGAAFFAKCRCLVRTTEMFQRVRDSPWKLSITEGNSKPRCSSLLIQRFRSETCRSSQRRWSHRARRLHLRDRVFGESALVHPTVWRVYRGKAMLPSSSCSHVSRQRIHKS